MLTLDVPDELDGADHAALLAAVDEHLRAVYQLRARLETLATAATRADENAAAVLAALGVTPGRPWRQPSGAHDAYPIGSTVTMGGKLWRSILRANVWEPGVAGWVDEGPAEPAPAPEAQLWVAGEAVKAGDLRDYLGIVYRCNQPHTTQAGWIPPSTPALWSVV